MAYYEDNIEFLRCECHCPEHIVVISVNDNGFDEEPFPPEFYIETQANQWRPFYKRIWVALKYIFGAELVWDNTMVHKDDIPKLQSALDHYNYLAEKSAKKRLDKAKDQCILGIMVLASPYFVTLDNGNNR